MRGRGRQRVQKRVQEKARDGGKKIAPISTLATGLMFLKKNIVPSCHIHVYIYQYVLSHGKLLNEISHK